MTKFDDIEAKCDMAPFAIRLLGSPEITINHQPISFRTRKVLALLIYLVVEGGMHSRESLMALFWPESSSKNAAVTLRGTLSRLRKSLQPAGQSLISDAGKVGFDFEQPVDFDLAWLDATVLPETTPNDLLAILDLDRGEFLTGFSLPDAPNFDIWATIQREACNRQVEVVYGRLTQHQLTYHDSTSAVSTAARWVARAPFSEVAYRRLMGAQALTGDRTAALRTFDQCKKMLQQEFGIEPERETKVLADHIRHDRVVEDPDDRVTKQRSAPIIPASLPFTGRAAEHSQLVNAFRQVNENRTQVVSLIGAAGVGKTRLVDAFQNWVTLDFPGVEVWKGRAFEMGGHLPYQPVIEALRVRLEQENAPEDLLDDIWLTELSQLIPELRARYPDLPPPMTGEANFMRSRLFAAVVTLGGALAARNPAVFILDDMQWADADTRDMVHYMAQRWNESGIPILMLLTVRQENFAADAALREWLTRLGRDVPLTRLLLDSLSGTEVQQLVNRLAVPDTDEDTTYAFSAWLWAETNGLPFFIEALLQMLVEEGILAVKETASYSESRHSGYDFTAALTQVTSVGKVPVPPGVREAIQVRLERLSKDAGALLLAAAVLGRECSFERLCQVANLVELDGLQAIETLLNGRLLIEGSAVRRPYTLAHDYIREVVYSENHEVRRRVFHRRALIALEANRSSVAECAFHALASQLDEPAFRFSLAAGDEALRTNAFHECLAHYDRAREIVKRMDRDTTIISSQSLVQLYQNRGRVLELIDDHASAQTNYQEMFDLATDRQDRTLELAALIAQCIIHATHTPVFEPLKARELGQAALDLAQELDDRASEARAFWGMMMVEFYSGGDSQKILSYGEEALSLARELGLKDLMGYVLGNLSWAYFNQEQHDAARRTNNEAHFIWVALGNLPMVADSNTIKLYIYRNTGEYDALLETGPEALRLSQSIDNLVHQTVTLVNMGDAHCLQGRLGQALANIETAMTISEENDDTRFFFGYYPSLINIYLFGGELEQAAYWADRLYASREEFAPVFRMLHLIAIVRAKIARGNLQEGEKILEQAKEGFDRNNSSSFMIAPLFVADGHLQLALGNPERTLDHMEEAIQGLRQVDSRFYLAEALWLQGKAWLALEKIEQAKEALMEAKAVAEVTSERSILWQILGMLCDLERMSGNENEAEVLRGQAQGIVNYIADHAGSETLRTSFLAQPDVRKLERG